MEHHRGTGFWNADRLGSICLPHVLPFLIEHVGVFTLSIQEKLARKEKEKKHGIQIRHRNRTGMPDGTNH